MARILVMNIPAYGHVNPTLPVVQELAERGHSILYYNTEEFRDRITRTGALFRAYPEPMPTSEDITALMREGNLVKVTRMLFALSEHLVPFMLDEVERERPDLIVHDSIALWGSIAARLLRLPTVASISHFILDSRELSRTKRETLHLLWRALPLMPAILASRRRLAQRYGGGIFQKEHLLPVLGDLNLLYTTEQLQPRSAMIDDRFRFVGPSILNSARAAEPFPFDRLTDAPLVYISLGTVHHTDVGFYYTAFEAFRSYPAQFVLSIGPQIAIESLGPIPANFIVRSRVPQLDVLAVADVFVTHGGMNSIHEGLYFGVPLVVIPHQFEQLFNARIVKKHGAGNILGDRLPYAHVGAGELRAGVQQVLSTPSYRQNAQLIAQELQSTGGYRQAADEIEAMIQGQIAEGLLCAGK
ncbi:MAG: glycosyl transferase [Anaerolineae bacterium]|nr:glycosyl transferase [Anaerolineae bacterium]